jgi:hypothetical protein
VILAIREVSRQGLAGVVRNARSHYVEKATVGRYFGVEVLVGCPPVTPRV